MSCGGRCPEQSATANTTKENVRAISGMRPSILEVALTRLAGLCLLAETGVAQRFRCVISSLVGIPVTKTADSLTPVRYPEIGGEDAATQDGNLAENLAKLRQKAGQPA